MMRLLECLTIGECDVTALRLVRASNGPLSVRKSIVSVCIRLSACRIARRLSAARCRYKLGVPSIDIPAMSAAASVLVVDDDQAVREMMADYLSEHGFEVAQAESGDAMRAAF